jgi:Tfp pilus assembly protein PilX
MHVLGAAAEHKLRNTVVQRSRTTQAAATRSRNADGTAAVPVALRYNCDTTTNNDAGETLMEAIRC